MTINALFENLWQVYSDLNPRVLEIRACLRQASPGLINDHIALRTLKHARFGMERLAHDFLEVGYEVRGHYHFEAKKLDAIHLEHCTDSQAPKVFISELLLDACSDKLQRTMQVNLIDRLSDQYSIQYLKHNLDERLDQPSGNTLLAASGRHWGKPSYKIYQSLLDESEYAAWFYVFGFVPNHFTVKINSLAQFTEIQELNDFLEAQGYALNEAGGKVKGTPELYLEQSSTMADVVTVAFQEGDYKIPSVFYEFAKRYKNADGDEFSAFIEGNADKIFESTNVRS
ncbi:hypothetical protein A3742_16885 [Oleiphilus sp. HI0071]|nr:hypothetical protein A3737_13625 [Oleiphilus sp. HI0065]KZY80684.1 hypothetical protein A3742_12565 [Oleiphilus sp. HI0071]KZY92394.1 hypothetical protein A3744_19180 [Oleiphilus sp. HI0073]KZZ55037.1 hypothetical protein A3760_08635 [Oleiphilus sp. HI0122]KZY84224.1 hypothetical protein A3742_16885 [Oleiphilus sp. HI0071]